MSDLTMTEKRRFERLLRMNTGYVLDFSNRTFQEFVADSTGRNIFDERYQYASGSKANCLRGFWTDENNRLVGKLLGDLLDHGRTVRGSGPIKDDNSDLEPARRIIARLMADTPVPEIDSLAGATDERDFDIVSKAARDAIERNEPEAGLDRLHTFVVKFVRSVCEKRGIAVDREKPLHSIFGEYLKRLKTEGRIESEMSLRILKSSISTLEAFNDVRNNRSLV
jgi:hypothetical protein